MKIAIEKIILNRAEGRLEGTLYPVDKPRTFYRFADANAMLRGIAREQARDGRTLGYDKVDFTIHWQDGETYSGRADVTADGDDTDLRRHVLDFLDYLACTRRPGWMDDATWQRACADNEREGYKARAQAMLDGYHLDDEHATESVA